MNKIINKDLSEIAKMKPSEYVEKYLGIKLFDYQKHIIDNRPPYCAYTLRQINGKRAIYFHSLCLHLYWMKEDEKVGIWKKSGYTVMNREEFANYLMNEYWL